MQEHGGPLARSCLGLIPQQDRLSHLNSHRFTPGLFHPCRVWAPAPPAPGTGSKPRSCPEAATGRGINIPKSQLIRLSHPQLHRWTIFPGSPHPREVTHSLFPCQVLHHTALLPRVARKGGMDFPPREGIPPHLGAPGPRVAAVTPNCTRNIALTSKVAEIILQEVSLLHDFLTLCLNLTQMEAFPSFHFPPFPGKPLRLSGGFV